MITTKLNNGRVVLAKNGKYGISALQYANRTQAAKKAAEVGGVIYRGMGRGFYVTFEPAMAEADYSGEVK